MRFERKLPLAIGVAIIGLLRVGLAMDQVLLRSGTKVSGTILGQSRDQLFMRIGEGNIVLPKKTIVRIYDDLTNEKPLTRMLARDELPPWWIPLSDLFAEDWVNSLEQIRATEIDAGNLQNVPYLSFRANAIYELNIYGDMDHPAAIELGYRKMGLHSRDAQKRCRQFMVSYLVGLKQLKALYGLRPSGGSVEVGGLCIEIKPPKAPDAYGGWWVTVSNPKLLEKARARSLEEWEAKCEQMVARMKRSTNGETSWRKYSLTDAFKRYLPMENVEER